MTRILFASDAPEPPSHLMGALHDAGFTVDVARTHAAVGVRVRNHPPDALVLHFHAPSATSIRCIARMRPAYEGPIVALAALSPEADEIHALELGIDDYIVLPAHPRRIGLRVRAVLSRNRRVVAPIVFQDSSLHVDAARGIARVHDVDLQLTSGEFRLLLMLANHAGQPLSRDTYFMATTGQPHNGIDRIMDVRMSYLRRKLRAAGLSDRRIRSVRGVGYQLNLEVAQPAPLAACHPLEGSIACK